MGKWVLSILLVLGLSTACIYFFIPRDINITDYTIIHANVTGAYRVLADFRKWPAWWPGEIPSDSLQKSGSPVTLTLNHCTYALSEKLYNAFKISIKHQKNEFHSKLLILPLPADSVLLKWESRFTSSLNPVKRLLQYHQAVLIKNNMTIIFKRLGAFLNKNENIYGYDIRQVIVKDSFLVSIKKILPYYPNTNDVYDLIHQLQHYADEQGAKPTNFPMLNVTVLGNDRFETRVAIPVDRQLKNDKAIISKRLVTGGNLIITTVTGGTNTINEAFIQLKTYIHDYQRTILAIPFESLVTDRQQEPDSAKWVTRLCYPIM